MSMIDPADYWMTPDEERKLEDKYESRRNLTTNNNNTMEQILINTYPAGVANKLGQDVMASR
jgi:hypothetical protein